MIRRRRAGRGPQGAVHGALVRHGRSRPRHAFPHHLGRPRASLLAGLTSVGIAMAIGVPLGLAAGFLGGLIDGLHQPLHRCDAGLPVPDPRDRARGFPRPSLTNAMLAIGITATPLFIRLTRGQVLSIKAEDYVEAASAVGNPQWRIAVRHILPNILPQLMVQATLTIASAIIAEASMSFLGLGLQPPAPSWGSMLNSAQRFLSNAPWMALWPGMAIFMTVLAFNLLGDGLRDALDPQAPLTNAMHRSRHAGGHPEGDFAIRRSERQPPVRVCPRSCAIEGVQQAR